jgi:phage terminase large subunit-like protein
MDGLEDVSGTATYSTAFTLRSKPTSPIVLVLNKLEDAFEVILNGQVVQGIDRMANTTGDIGPLLKPGENSQLYTASC